MSLFKHVHPQEQPRTGLEHTTVVLALRTMRCATCGRLCLLAGEPAEPQRCICEGELRPSVLSPGQYELIGQGPYAVKQEPDLPYGRWRD